MWTVPDKLRVTVAAANPTTAKQYSDHVNWLCVILDPDEETNDSKMVRMVGKDKNQSSDDEDPLSWPLSCTEHG